jgi:8-oxo-dGTP pyrophosphatase MutT (NUDIX family)
MPGEKTNWERHICAGGIVYKKDANGVFVLLVQPKGPNYGPPAGYWTFPKGKLDDGETDKKAAALREVREEGGVACEVEAPLGWVKFLRNGGEGFGPAIKIIDFFLMRYVSGDPADHDNEMAEAAFFPVGEVEGMLKFDHDREVWERARKELHAGQ